MPEKGLHHSNINSDLALEADAALRIQNPLGVVRKRRYVIYEMYRLAVQNNQVSIF